MDDTSAYQGYQTRFYRDSKENAVQIYLQPRGARVVLVWADAANESVGFTVRDSRGRPVRLAWGSDTAEVAGSGKSRTIEYRLIAHAARLELGWFLLGSMRVERDFRHARGRSLGVAEESLLVADVGRLPPDERRRHLDILGASNITELRSRLQPTIISSTTDTISTARIERPSLDGRNRLMLELRVDAREALVNSTPLTVSIRSRSGSPVRLTLRVTTDAAPLTPLSRTQIFNRAFLDFLAAARAAHDSVRRAAGGSRSDTASALVIRYRRLERQVRGIELLSAEEKLMAGLPNFATYFGRDMMMTALMMGPIWSDAMAEHVISSALRKLGPDGDVSHEEALGGQAIRENAVVYDSLITRYLQASRAGRRERAEAILTLAAKVLRELQATRENYHMIDDEFQLPVLEARYLTARGVPANRKRAFLLDTVDHRGSRLALMLGEMALVTAWTRPYVDDPRPENLVSFPQRDSTRWRSASWRDSESGYAGGRFAMDVNTIWAPKALEAIATVLGALHTLGFSPETLDSIAPRIVTTPLARYLRDSTSLRRAIEVWQGARRHFTVTLGPPEMRQQIAAKLAWLPESERRHWRKIMATHGEVRDSLRFLVLALDANGGPIPIVNTDPATGLFLESLTEEIEAGTAETADALRELEPFMRPYPVGLFVEGLGPVLANDAYAPRRIWELFRADPYQGPRAVWGREVNLLLLGLANQIADAFDGSGRLEHPTLAPYVRALDEALRRTLAAAEASGLGHNELWSYRIEGERFFPVRYGTSSDVQLWNTTDLMVEFVLSRLPRPSRGQSERGSSTGSP